ncbi:MAG: hypothetical protein JWP12_2356 [Bacteroidetes bacterium]|nr:hypothetical protein [Bacteroidota bacterium]
MNNWEMFEKEIIMEERILLNLNYYWKIYTKRFY